MYPHKRVYHITTHNSHFTFSIVLTLAWIADLTQRCRIARVAYFGANEGLGSVCSVGKTASKISFSAQEINFQLQAANWTTLAMQPVPLCLCAVWPRLGPCPSNCCLVHPSRLSSTDACPCPFADPNCRFIWRHGHAVYRFAALLKVYVYIVNILW